MLLKRIEQWDHLAFCRLFHRRSSYAVRRFSFWLSKTADGPLYLLLALCLWLLEIAGAEQFVLLLLYSFALELPLYLVLKNSIKRSRPAEVLVGGVDAYIVPSDRFSLPSGHTAGAFVIVTAAAVSFPGVLPLVLVWAVCIGLSRIMLGVHFPLDVIAGSILGTSCTLLTYIMYF